MTAHPWLIHYPRNLAWDAKLQARPLYDLLLDAARTFENRPCIRFMDRTFSFMEVVEKARRFAGGLKAMGVRKGDRVGLFLPNCPQFVIAYYGILLAGGTVVNFNPLCSPRDIRHQLEDSGTSIVVTLALSSLYPKLAEFLGNTALRTIIVGELADVIPLSKSLLLPVLKRKELAHIPDDAAHVKFARLLEHEALTHPVPVDPRDDIAVLQYTGGTTGVPKGTVLTHANLYSNAVQVGMWFEGLKRGEERLLGILPLFHVFGMTVVMNLAIHQGAEMLLHLRFDLRALLEDVQSKKITLIPGVPSMFAAVANHRTLSKYDLSSLKMCFSGGAALPREVKESFEKQTGCKLVEGYGLTETSPVVSCNPLFGTNKACSIGMPLPGTVLEIVDMDDGETLLPTGEIGELCIRGPQVMKGYWKKLEETALVLHGGRLHTGDIAKMDDEGYFFIVDRKKEMIITGGYNVYPRNIEEVLYAHPAVLEAAVVGVPDEARGQVGKAFVVRREGAEVTESQIRDYLRGEVAQYAVPAHVEFRSELPKTLIGKVDKKQLV